VERSLFYSTIIMVCALLPLFTMQGPEGQIFGPMADTYAFALGGALLAFGLPPKQIFLCACGPALIAETGTPPDDSLVQPLSAKKTHSPGLSVPLQSVSVFVPSV
jgi:Cu/Ag efflux pump CusA